jgi:hypothetical protein
LTKSLCLPAGCRGTYFDSCFCRSSIWICASWECFGPCQTSPGSDASSVAPDAGS